MNEEDYDNVDDKNIYDGIEFGARTMRIYGSNEKLYHCKTINLKMLPLVKKLYVVKKDFKRELIHSIIYDSCGNNDHKIFRLQNDKNIRFQTYASLIQESYKGDIFVFLIKNIYDDTKRIDFFAKENLKGDIYMKESTIIKNFDLVFFGNINDLNGKIIIEKFNFFEKNVYLDDIFDKETVTQHLKKNGKLIKKVHYQTEELCMIAAEQCPMCIKHIQNQTYDICMMAIKHDPNAIQYVKNQNDHTYIELCMIAIENSPFALKYMFCQNDDIQQCCFSNTYACETVCMEAVKRNGRALEYVKNQNENICLQAVKQNGMALKYVKEQNEDICYEAVKNDGCALQYVKNQTYEICMKAIENDKYAITYVNDDNITDDMMINIIDNYPQYGYCLSRMNQDAYQSEDLYMRVLEKNIDCFKYIKNKTYNICKYAIEKNIMNIIFVDDIHVRDQLLRELNISHDV
jgi:hypothetical protein